MNKRRDMTSVLKLSSVVLVVLAGQIVPGSHFALAASVAPAAAWTADEPDQNKAAGDEQSSGFPDESAELDPNNKDALAWYMAGHKALKRGELDDAEEAFRSAAEAAPESGVPLRALAMVFFRQGNAQQGLKTAQQAMEKDPDDWRTRMDLARFFAQNRRFPQTLQLIEQALSSSRLDRKSREFLQCHEIRGALLVQGGQVGPAAESYQVILAALIDPDSFGLTTQEHEALLKNRATGYELIGNVLLQAGRTMKAVEAFENLCRIRGDDIGTPQIRLAQALYQLDRLDESEQRLREFLNAGLRNREALVLLQDLYRNTSRGGELPAELQRLSEDVDERAVVQMFLGEVLLDQGETDKAAAIYRLVLEDSGDAEAYVGLIRVAITAREVEGVLDAVNQAEEGEVSADKLTAAASSLATLDEFSTALISACRKRYSDRPEDLQPLTTWFCATIAEQTERLEDQTELLKATLEMDPGQTLLLSTLEKFGTVQLVAGDGEMSVRVFEQLLAQPGLDESARMSSLYRISFAYEMLEDYESAARAASDAVRMGGNNPTLLTRLASVETLRKKYEEAEALFVQAIGTLEAMLRQTNDKAETTERLADARSRLATMYGRMAKWAESVEQYQAILALDGLKPEQRRVPQMLLSNALVQNGDTEAGVRILEELYKAMPGDPGLNNDLGYLYADLGRNLEQAEKMIRIALEAQPENPAYLDSLGWVLFRLGRNEEALEAMLKANSDPEYRDATLLEHQGDIHQALGQEKEARELWQQALQVEKDSAAAGKDIIERLEQKLKQ